MASTSLPLATAAAVATLFAAPAGAAPDDQPTTPPTPAPAQPDADEPSSTPEATQPESPELESEQDPQTPEQQTTPQQPGVTTPEQMPENGSTPQQPGVTTPEETTPENESPRQPGVTSPEQPGDGDDLMVEQPQQPGVTTPRVAPLPVPGQQDSEPPAATVPEDGTDQQVTPPANAGNGQNSDAGQSDSSIWTQPQWEAPRLDAAPPAPVVEMTGPHAEVGGNIDGGTLMPGYVANTHHFANEAGYVGTIGYSTPTGVGEAGASVEFIDMNTIHITTYTGGEGTADNGTTMVLDTTQLNMARAAVEDWIREQPGGAAALEAAANIELPLPPGEIEPQTFEVGGVVTQWGGSLQY